VQVTEMNLPCGSVVSKLGSSSSTAFSLKSTQTLPLYSNPTFLRALLLGWGLVPRCVHCLSLPRRITANLGPHPDTLLSGFTCPLRMVPPD
jgi:hypothetical protein